MSTLQFVILLVVIFLSTNGPSNFLSLVHKIKRWIFLQKVSHLRTELKKNNLLGKMFSYNTMGDTFVICLRADHLICHRNGQGLDVVEPLFVFRLDKEVAEKHLPRIYGAFLYELCGRKISKKYFSPQIILKALPKEFITRERKLFVPEGEVPDLNVSLLAFKNHLEHYILTHNRMPGRRA